MLYLNPPFYMINGVMIYGDHANPLQYYYMPLAPRLRRTKDPASGRMIPRFSLLTYRSAQIESGAFADFDVHLGLEPDELDDLRRELRGLARLTADPTVAPIPVVGGSVSMMLFGQESGSPSPDAGSDSTDSTEPPKRFVLKMSHAAKPGLYADNQAAFSVQLDQYGAKVLEDAMKGEMAPIGVVYSLDYVALRPAFSVRLNVDWDRVQNHLDESFGQEGMFTSVEIGKAVDELIESRAITLEADSFVADAEDQGGTTGRMEAAKARVQEMITDAFFSASLPPMTKEPDGWDKAKDIFNTIRRPMSIFGTFSYKRHSYQRVDRKRLDVTISERTSVMRTIYPQGHLDGLFRVLREGENPERFIRRIEVDDPWFAKRRVRLINRAEMEAEGLASVHAQLRYGTDAKDVIFEKSGEEKTLEWLNIVESGVVRDRVDLEVAVGFRNVDASERPAVIRSEIIPVTGDAYEIRTADMYAVVNVPVLASPSFPWPRYPQVEARLRYQDAAHGINMDERLLLTNEQPNTSWQLLRMDPALQSFEYKLVYHAADNSDIETAWLPTDSEFVDVRDPFPAQNRLRVEIVPVVARWEDVENLFVDVSYDDPAHNFAESASFTFSAQNRAPQPFIADLRDPARRGVSFQVTTVLKDGSVLTVPRSYTEAHRILVRPDMRGRRFVAVKPPDNFAAAMLERVSVELRFNDDANGIAVEDHFEFATGGGRQSFEYEFVDETRDRYEWRARFVFTSGMTRATEWVQSDANELLIRVP
jgi:hypothetical protein